MKNIYSKIFIILISFIIFCSNVYATSENDVSNENTEEVKNTEQTEEITTKEENKKALEEEKPTETEKNEIMYVQERCNIRAGYSVESERVGGLDVGTEVTVIAEYSNGWYKIKYGGDEAYIKAGILRSTKPEIPEETENEIEEDSSENTSEQTQNDETVPSTESPITENIISETPEQSDDEVLIEDAEIINEVGVLPEVGKNIADYLYVGIIMLAVIFVIYVKYKF